MDFYDKVNAFIEKESLLKPGQALVAGVSGGADSLCLLDCLHHLGYQLVVAHLDHQLRAESRDEAKFVSEVAQDYGIPIVVGKENVTAFARKGLSLEEAARIIRYRFLLRVAKDYNFEYIATGHNADDQVETVLMHFLRGAGVSGLSGMLAKTCPDTRAGITDAIPMPNAKRIMLVRPLLMIGRAEIEDHCSKIGLIPRQDSSNLDTTFFRNRLRHKLLPLLEDYNPGIRQVLLRMSRVMAGEADLVNSLTKQNWPRIIRAAGEGGLAIDRAEFKDSPIALQRAIMMEAIRKLRPEQRDISFEVIERGLEAINCSQPARLPLIGGLELLQAGLEVIISLPGTRISFPQYPQLKDLNSEMLPVPGNLDLADGWRLTAKRVPVTNEVHAHLRDDPTGRTAVFDADCVSGEIIVRSRLAGDRIQPLGSEGRIKVSDLLINLHIPQLARKQWPLVTIGDHVLWIVGLRMAHEARIKISSKRAIKLQLCPPNRIEN